MMQIFDCEQGSGDWFRARMGIPTASEFASVMANGKNGEASKTRRTYMLKLAGEILTGELMENYTNGHMDRGREIEDEARTFYDFMRDNESKELRRVGFIRNGNAGCSPDSLIGTNGMLEIKTKLPHLLIDLLLKDEFPSEHKAQCQGALWIAERDFIDIAVYWPELPLFVKRAERDEAYIAQLAQAVSAFNAELHDVVEKLRQRFESPKIDHTERDGVPAFLDRRIAAIAAAAPPAPEKVAARIARNLDRLKVRVPELAPPDPNYG
jgi:hypothetical protein